jgi:hypothetical protein
MVRIVRRALAGQPARNDFTRRIRTAARWEAAGREVSATQLAERLCQSVVQNLRAGGNRETIRDFGDRSSVASGAGNAGRGQRTTA